LQESFSCGSKKNIWREVMRYIAVIILFLVFLIGVSPMEEAYAAFDLSVTPYEGGYDLRYGQDEWIKEVDVRATSDIGSQYRIVQMLAEPLTETRTGSTLPVDSFRVYGLRGTNKYGTFSVEGVERGIPVVFGREILYTSNQTGTSDSFILVYKLVIPANQAPGSYSGKMTYILEPIGSIQDVVTVNLNVYVEVEMEEHIEINTSLGTKSIELKESDIEDDVEKEVVVSITGNLGRDVRILQQVTKPLEDITGNTIPLESVSFKIEEALRGAPEVLDYTPLSFKPEAIYSSGPHGETGDFIISYQITDIKEQIAGIYRSAIAYTLEGSGFLKEGVIDTLDLEVQIPKVFDIVITPETQGKIEFFDIDSKEGPQVNEVLIEVKTNKATPYQISQNILSALSTPEGYSMPEEGFTLKTEGAATEGVLKCTKKTVVKKGETVLFISDDEGSPDSFKIIYEIDTQKNVKSGNYSSRVIYSLTEL